jgi:capsular polysaccharide export protein
MSSILAPGGRADGKVGHVLEDWRKPVLGNPALSCLAQARRVLMLQGPVGPFFDRVAQWLLGRGCQVDRIVFHGGDDHDCRAVRSIPYTGSPSGWPAFLGNQLASARPDCIVLFGQNRLYHKVALERARASDLPVVVMEEGYFRPGFVTVELGGVNGYSTTLDRFEWSVPDPSMGLQPAVTGMHFQKMAWHACQHYIALEKQYARFPEYTHHRSQDVNAYAWYWVRSWFRKGYHRGRDLGFQRQLFASRKPYFFIPLQLEGDSQITQHSPFASNAEFILKVLTSFAGHAPAETILVFRQHPHSRGGRGSRDLVSGLANGLGIVHRIRYMVEGDTPDLAEHSQGTVVINSTVGLQALERGVPLIVLGDAPYKQPEFTFMGELDDFWRQRQPPDEEVTGRFLAQVKNLTQAPASVYALRSEPLAWTNLSTDLIEK